MSTLQIANVDCAAFSASHPRSPTIAILLISVLGLFLEMLLIRWIGTEVRIFAYLQNTVLVVCILGLGMGCFTCRQPFHLRQTLVPLLVLVGLLALPATRHVAASISDLLSVLQDFMIWAQAVNDDPATTVGSLLLGLAMTFVMMVLVWEIFVPLGRMLGRLMDEYPHTIWGYSVNVVGSLLGIWLFVAISALYCPPTVWFAIAGLLCLGFIGKGRERMVNLALLGLLLIGAAFLGHEPDALEVKWSPYQKLVLSHKEPVKTQPGDYLVTVNNIGYQGMINLGVDAVAHDPHIDPEQRGLSQYDLPMLFRPGAENVLIVGAGSGNDVAGVLRGGAKHVTAVEIDPTIVEMGRAVHPEHPYSADNVEVVIDDARSFFATTRQRYDLIIFGLLDSHTTAALTNMRLDHYVYTRESLARARSLLADGGVMVLSFDAVRMYVAHRMESCLIDVFGDAPESFAIPANYSGWGGVMFVSGDRQTIANSLAGNVRLANIVAAWRAEAPLNYGSDSIEIPSDDWPYIYLVNRRIPTLYYLLAGLLVALLGYCKLRLGVKRVTPSWGRSHGHFCLLGAAFMLLEVQSISKAAVVLGNTWIVNAVIISGILLMILCANLVASRWPRLSMTSVGSALVATCGVLYFVDLSNFAGLPYAAKAIIVGLLSTAPMFFSGLVFITSFRATLHKDAALGANLIGSLVGGLLQSLTFVIGINAVLLLVAGLYAAAFAMRSRETNVETTDANSVIADPKTPDQPMLVEA